MFLLIYLNEYNTVVQGFALQGTVTDQQNWTDTIKKAQVLETLHAIIFVAHATDHHVSSKKALT